MNVFAARPSLLRVRKDDERSRVTFVELFFDLVIVFAVTQLSHRLLKHLTPFGAVQTVLLMMAVWWAWIDTAWITNWLDPDKPAVRLLLFALMLAGLVLSSSIPRAFEGRALPFALAYVLMQLGRDLFMLWACLFVIIALGESVLITGANFADLVWASDHVAAFVVAFSGSVAMWVLYFNIGAERASRMIATSDDPGRLVRSGYTYIHILIVAGIIVSAVGDELVLHHPGGHIDATTLAAIIGGSALYLVGNALFKRLSAPYMPLSHTVGLGLLVLLVPAGLGMTPLVLPAAAVAVLIIVAAWEWASLWRPAVIATRDANDRESRRIS